MSGLAGFELHKLTAGYPGRRVIESLDLPLVAPGMLVALVGQNAVGKSTLLKAVAGLLPSSGQVMLDGQDLAALAPRLRLRRAGYLAQALPQGTSIVAYEALMGALRTGRPDMDSAEVPAAIEDVLDSLSIRELALRRLDELSGGQRQMIGLAQVIVRQPRLLLLDEPTSALDMRWQLRVLEGVRHMCVRSGGIALMAMHDLNLALRFCDRVLVLGPDGMRSSGAPREVITPALLRGVWGISARVESCSLGHPLVLADGAIEEPTRTHVTGHRT